MSHEHWGPSGFGVVWEGGHNQEGAEDSILTLALEWPLECPIVAVGDASCGLWARRAGSVGQVSQAGQPLTAPPHLEADRGLWSLGRGQGWGGGFPRRRPCGWGDRKSWCGTQSRRRTRRCSEMVMVPGGFT